jgi:hypothetical protein
MFDADRLLKCLDIGYDNVTYQPVSSGVPGYENMIQRELYGTGPASGQVEIAERMWFMPKEMKLYDDFAVKYKSRMISLFLMMMFLSGKDRKKRRSVAWVAV